MWYSATTFKDLSCCLKELEKFIRDGNHLKTGRPSKRFGGLRSREILALWLLCAVIESAILAHIEKKQKKGGAAYASGKTLVVFLNKTGGEWHPNKVARNLPKNIDFEGVWVVGLQNVIDEEYNYNVTQLNAKGSPIWRVHIKKKFDAWEVIRIQ